MPQPDPLPQAPNRSGISRVVAAAQVNSTSRQRPGSDGPNEPPRKRAGIVAWLFLAVCLAVIAPVMMIGLNRFDVISASEARALAIAEQTWSRIQRASPDKNTTTAPQDAQPPAPPPTLENNNPQLGFMSKLKRYFWEYGPTLDDQRLFTEPPGVTWAQIAGFWVVQQVAGPLDKSAQRHTARGVSVVMACLAVLGVFWACCSLVGVYPAIVGSLVCVANPLFLYHGRQAHGGMHHLAWTFLSIAAALWTIRPLRPAPKLIRQSVGWLLAGVMMGAAVLTTGPAAVYYTAAPLLLTLLLCPRKAAQLLGLLAAMILAALLVLPWVVFAHDQQPNQFTDSWLNQLWPVTRDAKLLNTTVKWFGTFAAGLLPWTPWLVGGAVGLFEKLTINGRRQLFICWSWLTLAALLGCVVAAAEADYPALPAVPLAGVMIAVVFSQYASSAQEGRPATGWLWLRWLHATAIVLLTVCVPCALYAQTRQRVFTELPILKIDPTDWLVIGSLCTIQVSAAAMAVRWMLANRPTLTAIGWAVWVLALSVMLVTGLSAAG